MYYLLCTIGGSEVVRGKGAWGRGSAAGSGGDTRHVWAIEPSPRALDDPRHVWVIEISPRARDGPFLPSWADRRCDRCRAPIRALRLR